jgi:hypothetical protein
MVTKSVNSSKIQKSLALLLESFRLLLNPEVHSEGPKADSDPRGFCCVLGSWSESALEGSWIRFCIEVKIQKLQRLEMKPWRFFRPVVTDSPHFGEEQDPDPH